MSANVYCMQYAMPSMCLHVSTCLCTCNGWSGNWEVLLTLQNNQVYHWRTQNASPNGHKWPHSIDTNGLIQWTQMVSFNGRKMPQWTQNASFNGHNWPQWTRISHFRTLQVWFTASLCLSKILYMQLQLQKCVTWCLLVYSSYLLSSRTDAFYYLSACR